MEPLRVLIGHNGGPPLDGEFAWGDAPIDVYFAWVRAHEQVWKSIPHATLMRRVELAGALGLTYEEYTSELMFNGRHLQASDVARIAEIKTMRPKA